MIKVKQEKDDKWVDKREGGEIVIWCESEIWTIGNREREKDEKEENEEGFVYWNWKEKQMKDLRIRDEERRKHNKSEGWQGSKWVRDKHMGSNREGRGGRMGEPRGGLI